MLVLVVFNCQFISYDAKLGDTRSKSDPIVKERLIPRNKNKIFCGRLEERCILFHINYSFIYQSICLELCLFDFYLFLAPLWVYVQKSKCSMLENYTKNLATQNFPILVVQSDLCSSHQCSILYLQCTFFVWFLFEISTVIPRSESMLENGQIQG